jgi:hypothetical protein
MIVDKRFEVKIAFLISGIDVIYDIIYILYLKKVVSGAATSRHSAADKSSLSLISGMPETPVRDPLEVYDALSCSA